MFKCRDDRSPNSHLERIHKGWVEEEEQNAKDNLKKAAHSTQQSEKRPLARSKKQKGRTDRLNTSDTILTHALLPKDPRPAKKTIRRIQRARGGLGVQVADDDREDAGDSASTSGAKGRKRGYDEADIDEPGPSRSSERRTTQEYSNGAVRDCTKFIPVT